MNGFTSTRPETCPRCATPKLHCRCKGVELSGGCSGRACACWSKLCCQCGNEYARRFVAALIE